MTSRKSNREPRCFPGVRQPRPGFPKGEAGRQPRRDSRGLSANDFRGLWRQEHTRSRSSGLICNPKGGRTIGGRGALASLSRRTVSGLYHDRRRFFAAVTTIAGVALAVLAALNSLVAGTE